MSPLIEYIRYSLGISQPFDTIRLALAVAVLYVLASLSSAVYDAFLGPLSKFPGPRTRALSKIPRMITLYRGTESTVFPALHRRYGPVVRIAPRELSYAAGAQAYQDIDGFKRPGVPKVYKDPSQYRRPFNNVDALPTANDTNHARLRKLLSPAFSDKHLRDLEPVLKEWCSKMVAKLREKAFAKDEVDLVKHYNCTTFDIMGDFAFNEGTDLLENGEYSHWWKAIFLGVKSAVTIRCIKYSGPLGEWVVDTFLLGSQRVRRKQAEHWNNSKATVDRRLSRNPKRPDLWSKILEKGSGPDGLTTDEHHSLGFMFMAAGTETTATALSGTTYWLLRSPEHLKRLTTEIRESHSKDSDLTLASVARLPFLHAVLQEGLRMYPPIPTNLQRKTPKGGAIICGEMVPEDTTVGIHHLSTFRNEDNFKRPWEFHPERWLGDPAFQDDHLDAFEPFTVGPRNCIGQSLAWHEMRLILSTTLFQFDLKLCQESSDWSDQKIFMLWEKKPLMCKLSPVQR